MWLWDPKPNNKWYYFGMTKNTHFSGLVSLLSAGFLFGTFGIWIRFLNSDMNSYQQVVFRNIIGVLVACLILYFRKIKIHFSGVSKKYLFLFGLSFPIGAVLFTIALLKTSLMLGVFSFYLGEFVFSLLIGMLVFHEKLTTQKLASLLLALLGFWFFIQPNGIRQINIGMIFGIFGGLFDTIANGFRKHLAGKLDRVVLTLVPLLGGVIVASTLMIVFNGGLSIPTISVTNWVVGLLFGISLFLIQWLTFYGFQHFDLNLGTIAISSEMIFASLFGWMLFAETPRSYDLIGGGMIVLAIVVGNWPKEN